MKDLEIMNTQYDAEDALGQLITRLGGIEKDRIEAHELVEKIKLAERWDMYNHASRAIAHYEPRKISN